MRVITILGSLTAALEPARNITASHFRGFPDVHTATAAQVIDVGIVCLLHNFANLKPLNIVIVPNVLAGAVIAQM